MPFLKNAVALTLFLPILILPACVTTSSGGYSGSVDIQTEDVAVSVEFSERDRELIYGYYKRKKNQNRHEKHKNKEMPPGLAKKEQLPPGLQKQRVKNGQLPPGLSSRELPDELERTLSELPNGYVRLKIEKDIIILDQRTNVVIDVIYDIDF